MARLPRGFLQSPPPLPRLLTALQAWSSLPHPPAQDKGTAACITHLQPSRPCPFLTMLSSLNTLLTCVLPGPHTLLLTFPLFSVSFAGLPFPGLRVLEVPGVSPCIYMVTSWDDCQVHLSSPISTKPHILQPKGLLSDVLTAYPNEHSHQRRRHCAILHVTTPIIMAHVTNVYLVAKVQNLEVTPHLLSMIKVTLRWRPASERVLPHSLLQVVENVPICYCSLFPVLTF